MALRRKKSDPDKKQSPAERARDEDAWLRKYGQASKAMKKQHKKDRRQEDKGQS